MEVLSLSPIHGYLLPFTRWYCNTMDAVRPNKPHLERDTQRPMQQGPLRVVGVWRNL